jgi:hypothetical protein
MATRISIALAVAVLASLSVTARADVALRSQRRNISIRVSPPSGWLGPGYDSRPSYDSFGWSHGKDPAACYLQIRFDPYTDEPGDRHSAEDIAVHWNTTPLTKIREQYKREFQNPQVDFIATVTLAGKPARVHAVYNADGNFYAAEVLHEGTVISFELRSPSRHELERHKAGFLSFLRSVQIRAI